MENLNLSAFKNALKREGGDYALTRITNAGAREAPLLRMLDSLVDRNPRAASPPFDLRRVDAAIRSLTESRELLAKIQGPIIDVKLSDGDLPTTPHVVLTIDSYLTRLRKMRSWMKVYNTRRPRKFRALKHSAIAYSVFVQTKRRFYHELAELIEAAYRVHGKRFHLSADAIKRFYPWHDQKAVRKLWIYCDPEIRDLGEGSREKG